jgi:hypothetical protein
VRHDELADAASRVVAHQRDVLQVERLQGLGHEPGQSGRRQIAPCRDRVALGAERQVQHDDLVAVGEAWDGLPPQPAVDCDAVDEDQWRARPIAAVGQAAVGQVDDRHQGSSPRSSILTVRNSILPV